MHADTDTASTPSASIDAPADNALPIVSETRMSACIPGKCPGN
jgi:hypothetical protein